MTDLIRHSQFLAANFVSHVALGDSYVDAKKPDLVTKQLDLAFDENYNSWLCWITFVGVKA